MDSSLPTHDPSILFDLQFLARNVGEDVAARRQIIQLFLSTSSEALAQMETFLLADQELEYRRLVHKMSPSLKILGMGWAIEITSSISTAIKNGAAPSSQMPLFLVFREKMEQSFTALQPWA